jgi:hypothetical protein
MAQHQRDLTTQAQLEPGTEAALLAAAAQGDHDAVEQLMIQYKPLSARGQGPIISMARITRTWFRKA